MMTQTSATQPAGDYAADNTAILPFQVSFPESDLIDLRTRINSTRWPERELVTDASQGVQFATLRKLASYWATEYDWRKVEVKLNELPQFITSIDGLDIHFIHVRSKHPNALPLIVTHGWPGSIIEFMKIIDPLTDPTAHGGSLLDAFDLVIPSLPGFGFSGKPTTTGWDPPRIARAWTTLMQRLGYTRFVAQGGDWGAMVTDVMGTQAPAELLGIHLNWVFAVPPEIDRASRPAVHCRPIFLPMNDMRVSNSISSTSMALVTHWRCRIVRKLSTESLTHQWGLPHGCSITTRVVTRLSLVSLMVRKRDYRKTTCSITLLFTG
jgi:pimeloyl-ACP methyl ester carboxylesterase